MEATYKTIDAAMLDCLKQIHKAQEEVSIGNPEKGEVHLSLAEQECDKARALLADMAKSDGVNPESWELE